MAATRPPLDGLTGSNDRQLGRILTALVLALATAGLLVVAGREVLLLFLAAIAVLFVLNVALVGLIVVLLSIDQAPVWMQRSDGSLRTFPDRMRRTIAQAWFRLRSRPRRSGKTVMNRTMTTLSREVWSGESTDTAYAFLLVDMHPETLDRLAEWMPLDDVAAEWAERYALVHKSDRTRSTRVHLAVATDDMVPPGTVQVTGTFAEPEHPDIVATASAQLLGRPRPGSSQSDMKPTSPAWTYPSGRKPQGSPVETPDPDATHAFPPVGL